MDAALNTTGYNSFLGSSAAPTATFAGIKASWHRCMEIYRLDRGQTRHPQILTHTELRAHAGALEPYSAIIERGLLDIYALIGEAGYEVTFCNTHGVTILNVPNAKSIELPHLECPGSLWTEDTEGTNGIGTSLWEDKAVSVYRDEHFLNRYVDSCCAAVPVRFPNGDRLGVFSISSKSANMSVTAHAMAFNVLSRVSESVERQLFRQRYQEHCILELWVGPGQLAIMASHNEGTLVAADRFAKAYLGNSDMRIDGRSLWQFFDRNTNLFHGAPESIELILSSNGSKIRGSAFVPAKTPSLVRNQAIQLEHGSFRRPAPNDSLDLRDATGTDIRMERNRLLLERVREAPLSILLVGETGTGKDVMARAIHAGSARSKKPFIAINCAAIPETLIDSELFGYGAGAFTGAKRDGHQGRVVDADGGTLFLDEIGDMPLALQTRLLRLLDTSEVVPVGGGKIRHVDIKVIAATNVAILEAIRKGRFRSDLYYRLAGVTVQIPALRDRTDFQDVVHSVLSRIKGGEKSAFTPAAMQMLRSHSWPGNIRELRNILTRAVCLAGTAIITPEHIFFDNEHETHSSHTCAPKIRSAITGPAAEPSSLSSERDMIAAALQQHGGDIELTAAELNISRATLYRRLAVHGISRRNL